MRSPSRLLFAVAPLAGFLSLLVACSGDDNNPPPVDGGLPDATVSDAGSGDATAPDTGSPDATLTDAESGDATAVDAGSPDAHVADAGTSDAETSDAGTSDGGTLESGDAGDGGDAGDASSEAGSDAIVLSFVTVGCNRIAKGNWDGGVNPSSANLPQLEQDFSDIAAMADAPKYFFFTGDLVLGLVPKLATLTAQLAAWTDVYTSGPLASKLALVPLPGNHEILAQLTLDDGGTAEVENNAPDAAADGVWTSWLSASSFDSRSGNGPTTAAPNADALLDDQSKLSYSFDDGSNHYVVLNTDTWTAADGGTGAAPVGWVPMAWLTADLQAAQANTQTKAIFVFGHKPLVSPAGATDPDDVINGAFSAQLMALLDGTAKVKGYFCAHYHAWDARTLPGTRGVYQIIAGNGGSTLDVTWNPPVTYYGFTEVRVHASGAVGVVSYQRAVPNPYYSEAGVVAATPQTELMIAP